MSNNNPYAVNGYGAAPTANSSNPYGGNPYGGSNPYAPAATSAPAPTSAPGNASTTSLNSRERSRSGLGPGPTTAPDQASAYTSSTPNAPPLGLPSNPYGRAPPPRRNRDRDGDRELDRPSAPTTAPTSVPTSAPTSTPVPQAQNQASTVGGGYGGLGMQQQYQRRDPEQDGDKRRPGPPPSLASHERERERDATRSQLDRRIVPDNNRDRPPMPKLPSSQSSLRPSGPNNNSGSARSAHRQHSPNRPTKDIDEILKHIQTNWKMMEGDECMPVKVALQLADNSSLGLGDKEQDFTDTHFDLQKSLKSVVNEHYADFNSAVGTYHKIQSSIRESQSRVRYLKNGLVTVRGGMLTTRPELRNLAEQSGELDDLLVTVNQMEQLRDQPAKLEDKINEKRWLAAVDILGHALTSCRKTGLDDIGAMADLRSYFATQESSLIDMLIEELHDHLYLKSPYCADRWKGRKVGNVEMNVNPRDSFGGNAWDRPVYHFLAALDTKQQMVEDASKNPESDTFYYIQMIVEALNRRGYLEELITRIEQRLPVELYKVVERTNHEIDAKYPSALRATKSRNKKAGVVGQPSEADSNVLSDFLWTLYAKFEAIAEAHRVLHEVVLGIVDREKLSKPEQYGASFKELWKLYQMEIRSLLHDYLATDGDTSMSGGKHSVSASDVFARHPRDKNKRMFKLSELDENSSDIKLEEHELDEILKSSVPGLVTKSKSGGASGLLADRGNDATVAGHKMLIDATVFNITILLPPSLTFLQHLKDIVPQTSNIPMSTLTSFLDDFLINVFHPQLEEAVTDLCTENILDVEAFMEDQSWSRYSPHPVFKGTIGFMSLVRAFSSMLSEIPQDQMFTQLITTQLFKYYDRSFNFYKNIVSRVSQANQVGGIHTTIMKAAAGFADEGSIREIVLSLWNNEHMDKAARSDLMNKEVKDLIAASKATPIQAYDIISDRKSVHQLSLVYNSMQWLAASLSRLRHVDASKKKTHSRNTSLTGQHNPRRWTLINTLQTGGSNGTNSSSQRSPIYLPLTTETVIPFDETLLSFRSLAIKALLTLHLDIRCGIIHQLGRSLRPLSNATTATDMSASTSSLTVTNPNTPTPTLQGQVQGQGISASALTSPNTTQPHTSTPPPLDSGLYPFILTHPPTSASPLILTLNTDLIAFEASISHYLGRRERRFVLAGLGRLVDRYLVVGADFIGAMNLFGAERMRVDGMVVQQGLRGLGVGKIEGRRDGRKMTNEGDNGVGAGAGGVGLGLDVKTGGMGNRKAEDEGEGIEEDEDALLTSSSHYYELFSRGSDEILAYIKEKKARGEALGFDYNELRTLIELSFSADVRGDDREVALKARKKMNDSLLLLQEMLWDS